MKATFVSLWDGETEVRASCEYNPETHIVTDIESVEIHGLDILEREYIELPDGTEVDSFIREDEEEGQDR